MAVTQTQTFPRYLVLDGGMGTEITRRAGDFYRDVLWTSRVNETNEELVRQIQKEFLDAGADLILTNTYRPSIDNIMKTFSINKEAALEFLRKNCRVTRDVRDSYWNNIKENTDRIRPLVGAAIGTYGTSLQYSTDYAGHYIDKTSIEEMVTEFRDKTRALLEGGVDILAFETIPAIKEAEAIIALLAEFPGVKAWIAFCCKDAKHIGSGEKFSDAVLATLACDAVVGVGVNCSGSQYVTSLLKEIPDSVKEKKSIVVYPNNGQQYDNVEKVWRGDPETEPIEEYISDWLAAGATWIGGCCSVTPDDIAKMRTKMAPVLKK